MRGLLKEPFSPFWFDRSSPLADQIAILWHAAANRELLSGQFGTLSGSTPPVPYSGDLDRLGGGNTKTMKFAGGAAPVSYLGFGSQAAHANIAQGPMTLFAVLATTGASCIAGHSDNNVTNAGWALYCTSANALDLRIERASANTQILATLPSGQPNGGPSAAWPFYTVAVTVNNGSLTSPTAVIYCNGIANTAPTVSAGSGVQGSDAAQTLYIGGNQSGFSNVSMSGGMEMFAAWRRVLAPGEIAALHRDRLQLFRRANRMRAMVPGVASAASARPVVFCCT